MILSMMFAGTALVVGIVCIILILNNKKGGKDGADGDDGKDSASRQEASGSDGFTKTGITFYGQSSADDNGVGFAGVDLFKHGKSGLEFKGKPLFPAAVFQDDAAGLLWGILEVKSDAFTNNKAVYVHVVDVCNSGQSVCQRNTDKHGFLVDIHATAFDYVGVDDGLLQGEFKKVGSMRPKDIKENIWLKDGTVACSCTGKCKGGAVKWDNHKKC
jgi:hypothetical protein